MRTLASLTLLLLAMSAAMASTEKVQQYQSKYPKSFKKWNQFLPDKVKAKIPLSVGMMDDIARRKKASRHELHGKEKEAKNDHLRGGLRENQYTSSKNHVLKVFI